MYKVKLRKVHFFSLQKRRLRERFNPCFQLYHGGEYGVTSQRCRVKGQELMVRNKVSFHHAGRAKLWKRVLRYSKLYWKKPWEMCFNFGVAGQPWWLPKISSNLNYSEILFCDSSNKWIAKYLKLFYFEIFTPGFTPLRKFSSTIFLF